MAVIIDSCATEHIVGPPTHILIPAPSSMPTGQDSSDYETASSTISTTSIEGRAKVIKQRTCCGITYERFKKAIKVKRKFIPAKISYFFFYSARSVLATYFIVFLIKAGLDPEQAGIIQGIRMAVLTLGGLFWGMLADLSKKNTLIMAIELICFSVFMFAKPWVAYWITSKEETNSEHRMHVAEAVGEILKTASNKTEELRKIMVNNSNAEISAEFGLDWKAHHYNTGTTPLFVSMLGLGVASAFFAGGCQILLDSKIMQMAISKQKEKNTYGRQRLWGSVAYSITPVILGLFLESLPQKETSLLPLFYIHLVLITLTLLSCIVLFQQKTDIELTDMDVQSTITNTAEQSYNSNEKISSFLLKTMKNPHMLIFLFNVFWMGMGNGFQWSFQFIYIQEMNATKTVMGVCVFLQCVTEAVIFPIAGKINKKIGGNKAAITIGLLGYGVTFTIYYVIKLPSLMVAVTSIIGVTYTLFYTAALDELYKASNPNCITTMQALYNSIFCGFGSGLSGIIGGFIYKNYGGKIMYLSSGLCFLFMGVVNIVYSFFYKTSPLSGTGNRSNELKSYKQFLDIYIPSEEIPTAEMSNVPVPISVGSDDAISMVMDDNKRL
ncbi:major facilitator superfamily domain-containing protein 6-A-like [Hydractinia symbiolongicarpus]|uniref:major facilitator superfamily domain-containing protein 6-A-like n=1 Tax=Hydractinia symbiolongicarpus TaxID=13093 RepID=UPI0025517AEA|nr:major facilitator superfamily domain-containing protein 6-A-like [Hydractinia symbiolongicarpus]